MNECANLRKHQQMENEMENEGTCAQKRRRRQRRQQAAEGGRAVVCERHEVLHVEQFVRSQLSTQAARIRCVQSAVRVGCATSAVRRVRLRVPCGHRADAP